LRALFLCSIVVLPLGQGHAQRQSSSTNWVTLGLGQATWGGLTELGGQFTFSHRRGRIVVTGRGLVGFALLGDVLQVPGMITSVEDYGLMVGAGSRPGLIRYSLGAGVGAATITRKGSSGSADSPTKTFGVALEGRSE